MYIDVRNVVEQFGITAGEEPYFMALALESGITQDELTQRVNVNKSATARAVKSLETKGFIRREIDPFDKRNKRLYLTEEAKMKYIALYDALWEYNRKLTEELTDEQYHLVYDSLEMLLYKLEHKKIGSADIHQNGISN